MAAAFTPITRVVRASRSAVAEERAEGSCEPGWSRKVNRTQQAGRAESARMRVMAGLAYLAKLSKPRKATTKWVRIKPRRARHERRAELLRLLRCSLRPADDVALHLLTTCGRGPSQTKRETIENHERTPVPWPLMGNAKRGQGFMAHL